MYTTTDYRLRSVGQNPSVSRVAGINVPQNIVLAMLASGELTGLAVTIDLISISSYRLFQPADMSMLDPGFIGVAVSLLARLNPIGVIFSALLFGGLQVGQMPCSWWFTCSQNWPLLFKPRFYCWFWVSVRLNKEPHFRKKPKIYQRSK